MSVSFKTDLSEWQAMQRQCKTNIIYIIISEINIEDPKG